jgi:endoglucanase
MRTLARSSVAAAAAALICTAASAAAAAPAAQPGGAAPNTPATAQAVADGRAFLDRYLLRNGRAVRREQGNDGAAASQADAMLIAVAARDPKRFSLTWGWTKRHLVRRDGLLASHWQAGHVVDLNSASDADLDAARALLLAGYHFRTPSYRAAGLRLGKAVLAHETVNLGGHLTLLAGTWARAAGSTAINPSYDAPRTYEQLAGAARDRRFLALERSGARAAAQLMSPAGNLAPDWAMIDAGYIARPTSVPGLPDVAAQSSFDAARLPIRYAEACDPASVAVAALPWAFYSTQTPESLGTAYGLDGTVLIPDQTAVMLVGAAASANAAGQPAARDAFLAQAETINTTYPTYYGAAWLALGRVALTTRLLGGCASSG